MFKIPVECVSFGVVVDFEHFDKDLSNFFLKQVDHGKAIILLQSELVFVDKTDLVLAKEKQGPVIQMDEMNLFLDVVPIDRSEILFCSNVVNKVLYRLATGKNLVKVVVDALKQKNVKVTAVVPLKIDGILESKAVSLAKLDNLFEDLKTLKKFNFLETMEKPNLRMPQSRKLSTENHISMGKIIIFGIVLVIFVMAILYAYKTFN